MARDRGARRGAACAAGAAGPAIVVHDHAAFAWAVLLHGELGLGESFVRGEWECARGTTLVGLFAALARSPVAHPTIETLVALSPAHAARAFLFGRLFGSLDRAQSARSIAAHYEDSHKVFRAFLGDEMVYTSAMWQGALPETASLRDAQAAKVARMIELSGARPGEKTSAHYGEFVAVCDRALRPGGRVVMQVIHAYPFNNPVAREDNRVSPRRLGSFVTTHVFPAQQIPNLDWLHEAFLRSGKFRRVFTETASHDYARTLALWRENLETVRSTVPPRTYRKYQYYLSFCEAGFRAELLHLSRVVFEKQ
jgi:cyclopropane fatty-acyl-phospholipid synthase-like methyltransferase